jgi:hypothetical protein
LDKKLIATRIEQIAVSLSRKGIKDVPRKLMGPVSGQNRNDGTDNDIRARDSFCERRDDTAMKK